MTKKERKREREREKEKKNTMDNDRSALPYILSLIFFFFVDVITQ
jgi:hypothetical protein